ncbi:histone-lysine N-methyltransferase NSD2-like [Phymastichus coffea]|uniref:histone-lysine N-methyltransferase NSD2-like n=1 Tax=Phymastichus coffea TaxID=108790 RepID=UPI00273B3EB1|nr:histone-lysine N-methyltransferase NSD2-like [Phymastichus coffea]
MENENITMQSDELRKDETEYMEIHEEKAFMQETQTIPKEISISQSISINKSMTFDDILQSCEWEVDDLAWARMSIYPFWPCIVTYDPSSLMTYKKVQSIRNSKTLMIHVHFFNDSGRHCWVPAHHMIPFVGIEDFRKRANMVTDMIRKKEPKFAAALTIKPSTFLTWQKAVAEAMDVLYDLDHSSLENFKINAKDIVKVNPTKSTIASRKRKRKYDKNTAKVTKTTVQSNGSNIDSEIDDPQLENLNLETPPVSPANEEDLRVAVYQKQKRISKMINKLQPPDFEVYFERNLYTIKERHPESNEDEIREYLQDIWNQMSVEDKQKYRSTYKIEADS